jgi:hypothetical protein
LVILEVAVPETSPVTVLKVSPDTNEGEIANTLPPYPPVVVTGMKGVIVTFLKNDLLETATAVVSGGGTMVRANVLDASCPA